jgi:hypothetical protein
MLLDSTARLSVFLTVALLALCRANLASTPVGGKLCGPSQIPPSDTLDPCIPAAVAYILPFRYQNADSGLWR